MALGGGVGFALKGRMAVLGGMGRGFVGLKGLMERPEGSLDDGNLLQVDAKGEFGKMADDLLFFFIKGELLEGI